MPFFVFLAFLFLGACAPLQVADYSHLSSSEFAAVSVDQEEDIYGFDLENSQRKYIYYKPFPRDNNEYVKKWLYHYSRGEGRITMTKVLERSSRYLSLMEKIFKEEGLPEDLVHMVMLESKFDPHARSSKGAVGYWQFMTETAGDYDLKINGYIDERQDFVQSTRAAARYLRYLYGMFGDWRLSMAGYNSGEGTVSGAIEKYDSRNFWYLASKGAFLPETKEFVPIIIAMRKIALRPWAYGFSDLNYQTPLEYGVVSLNRPASMYDISEQLNVPYEELKSLNPKFKTDYIPVEGQETYFRIPAYIRI